MAILLACGGLIFWLGAQAPNEGGMPPAYQSILLVTGAFGLYAGLLTAADVLGANFDGRLSSGALLWTSLALGGLLLWPAFERNSAISLLLAALLGGVALLSAWHFVFRADSVAPYRWLLAAYAAFLVLSALALREPARRHAEVLIDAGGLAIAAIAVPRSGSSSASAAARCRASGRSCCWARASDWSRSARSTARPGRPTWASSTSCCSSSWSPTAATRRCSGGRSCCS